MIRRLREALAWRVWRVLRATATLFNIADLRAGAVFIQDATIPLGRLERMALLWKYYRISLSVESPHRQWEILSFVREILRHPRGSVFVEAGSFKGSSTAKFSLAARSAGSLLCVFDSFAGIPENSEPHDRSIFGQDLRLRFAKGTYAGSLEEVQGAVRTHGAIENCEFVKGWFDDTLPHFSRRLSGAYVDVDLASSTRTCIEYLFPLLGSGDLLISQDGHIPLVIDVFLDQQFWITRVHLQSVPRMEGIRTSKIVKIEKP